MNLEQSLPGVLHCFGGEFLLLHTMVTTWGNKKDENKFIRMVHAATTLVSEQYPRIMRL